MIHFFSIILICCSCFSISVFITPKILCISFGCTCILPQMFLPQVSNLVCTCFFVISEHRIYRLQLAVSCCYKCTVARAVLTASVIPVLILRSFRLLFSQFLSYCDFFYDSQIIKLRNMSKCISLLSFSQYRFYFILRICFHLHDIFSCSIFNPYVGIVVMSFNIFFHHDTNRIPFSYSQPVSYCSVFCLNTIFFS